MSSSWRTTTGIRRVRYIKRSESRFTFTSRELLVIPKVLTLSCSSDSIRVPGKIHIRNTSTRQGTGPSVETDVFRNLTSRRSEVMSGWSTIRRY